jgi:hypothetical protein
MKRIYKLFAMTGLCLLPAGQAAAEEVVTYVFSDLTPANTNSYSLPIPETGISVTVKTGGLVDFAENGTAITAAACNGTLNIPAGRSYLKLQGTSANPLAYVMVTFPAGGVRKVAIYGRSGSGNIDVFYAHSTAATPTALSDFSDHYLDMAGEPAAFSAANKCLSVSGSGDLPDGTTGVVFGTSGNTGADFISGWGTTNITNGSAKPFQIYAITLTVVKQTGTGIGEPATAAKTPLKSAYYDLTGKTVSSDAKGFVIRKTVYSDGSVNNEKTYNR